MEKSLTQQAEFEHQRRLRIYNLKRLAGASLIELGKELYEAEKNKAWEKLGFDNWTVLMTAPEESGGYSLVKSYASKLKAVYVYYVVSGLVSAPKLKEIGEIEKLYEGRALVKTAEDLEEIRVLSFDDIKIKKAQKGEPFDCQHQEIRKVTIFSCNDICHENLLTWTEILSLEEIKKRIIQWAEENKYPKFPLGINKDTGKVYEWLPEGEEDWKKYLENHGTLEALQIWKEIEKQCLTKPKI